MREPFPCPKTGTDGDCGQEHTHCAAHTNRQPDGTHDGPMRPCRRPPVPGAGVCRFHGGAARTTREAAARTLATRQLKKEQERAVATLGLPRTVDPGDALLEEVRRTAGHVEWLGNRIAALNEDALTWARTMEVTKGATEFKGTDTTWEAVPPVLLTLYLNERKHLLAVCTAALKAGVEERRVRLAEQLGAMLADTVRLILADLEITAAQEARAATVVPLRLAQIGQAIS